MTTLHLTPEKQLVAYVKGSPETILELSSYIHQDGKRVKLNDELRRMVLNKIEEMASQALRVFGFAYRVLPENLTDHSEGNVEKDLVFVGLMGIIDPPREEAKDAIKLCERAGIKVIMITGDHKLTAVAIAKEIGIMKDGLALTGNELDKLSDDEFAKIVESISVYARVSPQHKLKIVKALKNKGHVVAMTGDGINDAPAVKQADIGIAMDITGTDVTKEASDMILTDDNFATIVNAVKGGASFTIISESSSVFYSLLTLQSSFLWVLLPCRVYLYLFLQQ